MITPISSLVLQSGWVPSGETKTGIVLFQSIIENNQNDCQFVVRLKYGVNGLETPIYTETKSVFLEPGSSVLIDFRNLVPDSFSFSNPDTRWVIETRLGFNFNPITLEIKEISNLSVDQNLILAAINGKADKNHLHLSSEITGLSEALDSKLDKPTGTPTTGQVLTAIDANTWEWANPSSGGITGDHVSSVNGLTGDVTLPSYQLATYQQDGLIDAKTMGVLRPQFANASTRVVMCLAGENRVQLIGTDEFSFGNTVYWTDGNQSGLVLGTAGNYHFVSSTLTAGQILDVSLYGDYGYPYRVCFTNLTAASFRLKPFNTGEKMTILNTQSGTKATGQSEYLLAPNKCVYIAWSRDYLGDAFLITVG